MEFWDPGISALKALGVDVSPEQLAVLEQGGEVLYIEGLPSPLYWVGDTISLHDQAGIKVYVPVLLKACTINTMAKPTWHVKNRTVAAELNKARTVGWRTWPSYIGEVRRRIDTRSQQDRLEDDEGKLAVVRVWDGIAVDDLDLVEDIFTAATYRIKSSVFEAANLVADFECESGCNLQDLDQMEACDDRLSDFTQQFITDVREAYEFLLAGHWIVAPFPSDRAVKELKPIEFEPMESLLVGNPAASDMWNRLVNHKEATETKINIWNRSGWLNKPLLPKEPW